MSDNVWDIETPIKELNIELTIPNWIDGGITPSTIAAIKYGGCESGVYMPAVTYHIALEIMEEYGNEIFDQIENSMG